MLILALGLLLTACAETTGPETQAAALPPPPPPEAPAAPAPAPRQPASATVTPAKPAPVLHLDVIPADATLERTLRGAMKGKPFDIRSGSTAAPGAHRLVLRHFRWNEGEQPRATRTVTYRPDQVTARSLPADSLYQVDYLTGTAVVGFSFRLTLERDGVKLAETEVTDRVEAPWSSCRLARIVAPSGTARAAQFVANAEMETLCAGQAAPAVSAATASKLADAVLSLPLSKK